MNIKKIYNSDAYNSSNYSKIISSKHVERLKDLMNNNNIIYGGNYNIKTKFFEPTIVEIENNNVNILRKGSISEEMIKELN